MIIPDKVIHLQSIILYINQLPPQQLKSFKSWILLSREKLLYDNMLFRDMI